MFMSLAIKFLPPITMESALYRTEDGDTFGWGDFQPDDGKFHNLRYHHALPETG